MSAGRAGFRARQVEAAVDPRPYDLVLDHAWARMIERLQAWRQLLAPVVTPSKPAPARPSAPPPA